MNPTPTNPQPVHRISDAPPLFQREPRYLVVKIKDANAYLSPAERDTLERLCAKCGLGRIDSGKRNLECVVVESDWPEYDPTWSAIEARMTVPTPPKGSPEETLKPNDEQREYKAHDLTATPPKGSPEDCKTVTIKVERYATPPDAGATAIQTDKFYSNMMAILDYDDKLQKMTAKELILEVLGSTAADYRSVTELMNRVLPNFTEVITDEETEAPCDKSPEAWEPLPRSRGVSHKDARIAQLERELADLRNAGGPPFIRSEAIRNLKSDMDGLKQAHAATREQLDAANTKLERADARILDMSHDLSVCREERDLHVQHLFDANTKRSIIEAQLDAVTRERDELKHAITSRNLAIDAYRADLAAKDELLAKYDDPAVLHAHCLRYLTEAQIAHLFGERMTAIVNDRRRPAAGE